MPPKISIIIPVFNTEKFIARCLDSVLGQTFGEWEALVIDNNSTDKSASIIKQFAAKDSRIKYLNCTIQGPGPARNMGIENAAGDYLMFLDSDDYYKPNACEDLLSCIEGQGVDYALTQTDLSSVPTSYTYKFRDWSKFPTSGFVDVSKDKKTLIRISNLGGKIFKKALIDMYDIRFGKHKCFEDVLFESEYSSVANSAFFLNKVTHVYDFTNETSAQKVISPKEFVTGVVAWICELNLFMKNRGVFSEANREFFDILASNSVHILHASMHGQSSNFMLGLLRKEYGKFVYSGDIKETFTYIILTYPPEGIKSIFNKVIPVNIDEKEEVPIVLKLENTKHIDSVHNLISAVIKHASDDKTYDINIVASDKFWKDGFFNAGKINDIKHKANISIRFYESNYFTEDSLSLFEKVIYLSNDIVLTMDAAKFLDSSEQPVDAPESN